MKTVAHGALLGLAAALIPSVAAHGYVSSITIDGEEHKGPNVADGEAGAKYAIRAVNTIDPVKGASNPDILCGPGAKATAQYADAKPGSEVEVQWVGGGGQKWPHEVGPLLTYLAACPDSACDSWDAKDAQWFKIDEQGMREDGTWVHQDLMQGLPAKLTLPPSLAPGAYLLRHEIIALHNAINKGGAEFYESCAQIKVAGGDGEDADDDEMRKREEGKPDDSELVSFPGAYKDDDKGILVDAYDLASPQDYVFPGPPVARLAGGASSNSTSLGGAQSSGGDQPTQSSGGDFPTQSSGGDFPTEGPDGGVHTSYHSDGVHTSYHSGSGASSPTTSDESSPTTLDSSPGASSPTSDGTSSPSSAPGTTSDDGGVNTSYQSDSGVHTSYHSGSGASSPTSAPGTTSDEGGVHTFYHSGGAHSHHHSHSHHSGGGVHTSYQSGSGAFLPTSDGSSPTTLDSSPGASAGASLPTSDGFASPSGDNTTSSSADGTTSTSEIYPSSSPASFKNPHARMHLEEERRMQYPAGRKLWSSGSVRLRSTPWSIIARMRRGVAGWVGKGGSTVNQLEWVNHCISALPLLPNPSSERESRTFRCSTHRLSMIPDIGETVP
ncbi:glycoside hydrolase family 61 protein [Schizophyllum commune]